MSNLLYNKKYYLKSQHKLIYTIPAECNENATSRTLLASLLIFVSFPTTIFLTDSLSNTSQTPSHAKTINLSFSVIFVTDIYGSQIRNFLVSISPKALETATIPFTLSFSPTNPPKLLLSGSVCYIVKVYLIRLCSSRFDGL